MKNISLLNIQIRSSVPGTCSCASLWIESARERTTCTAKKYTTSLLRFGIHGSVFPIMPFVAVYIWGYRQGRRQRFVLRGHIARLNKQLCMFIAFINDLNKQNKTVKFYQNNNKCYARKRHCSLVCLCRQLTRSCTILAYLFYEITNKYSTELV